MTVKDIARQVIDSLPDEVGMDEIMHALYVRMKFEHGKQGTRDGKSFFQEEAKRRFQKWVH
ncbi:MAG: hypothetical protein K6U80_15880 [Firmicutes bacterium]|nr:hypothetical protein [Bacillota bacterium]